MFEVHRKSTPPQEQPRRIAACIKPVLLDIIGRGVSIQKNNIYIDQNELQGISLDTVTYIPYIEKSMLPTFTSYIILVAITIQGVFGGLQNSVSICLGGGHEHAIAEVVEQCEMECSHHSDWPTPITSNKDIDNCDCTDLELGLITLLSTSRTQDNFILCTTLSFVAYNFIVNNHAPQFLRGPPQFHDDDLGMMHRIAVIRSTRLRV
jgi:hypothetical protein